ncbi:hypothetical protein DID88_001962 [Monilinia fructigena]|uniref:Uncharacterized protein n=1 Tax=Monilinia fructigena TaxID=38457 RepID=A0A395IWW9_9HELO|nr:hypothetical protein DID88_001962 [Monilinia fructigena]
MVTKSQLSYTKISKKFLRLLKGWKSLRLQIGYSHKTPQFTFSTDQSDKPKKKRHPLPRDLPPGFKASFTARNGVIIEADIQYDDNGETVQMGRRL